MCVAAGFLWFVDRYPLIELVISTRNTYGRELTPGMYTVPDKHKSIELNRDTAANKGPFEEIKLDGITLAYPKEGLLDNKYYGAGWHRIAYSDGKVVAIIPGVPDLKIFKAQTDQATRKKYGWFLEIDGIKTRRDLVAKILRVTPEDLSFFDHPLNTMAKSISLSLKRIMVPSYAHISYWITINNGIQGFQVGLPSDKENLVFIHLFDKNDKHHQLICYNFTEDELSRLLSGLNQA